MGLPTLPVLSMLPSVRLKLMLVFCMEDMDMVVLDILELAMLVLDMAMLPLLLLAMVVLAMLDTATMARGLLMPSLRLMLVCTMEDMDTVLVLAMLDMDILVLDMPDMVLDMPDMVLDMEDMVWDMAVPSMVKQLIYASKSSKAILLLFSAL